MKLGERGGSLVRRLRDTRLSLGLMAGMLIVVVGGCHTVRRMPEVDLSRAGWRCGQGQAVWQSSRESMPAMSGDLRVCFHRSNQWAFIQFHKPALNVMLYQERGERWYLEMPSVGKHFSGRMPPPRSLVWPRLIRHIRGRPPGEDWRIREKGNNGWLITNVHNKGWLKGYLRQSEPGLKP